MFKLHLAHLFASLPFYRKRDSRSPVKLGGKQVLLSPVNGERKQTSLYSAAGGDTCNSSPLAVNNQVKKRSPKNNRRKRASTSTIGDGK